MKIVVVGGGNIGTLLCCELAHINRNASIVMYTRNVNKWENNLIVTDSNKNELYTIDNVKITDDIVDDADYYFFTLPKNVIRDAIINHINRVKDATFVFVPGTGGVEFLYPLAKSKNIDFVGLQRVPYIARLNEYGSSVSLLSKKDKIYVSSMGKKDVTFLSKMLDIDVELLPNYLCVTLTPSNPILHTTRLYSMFSQHPIDYNYNANILFYESWDNYSSENLIGADNELQTICKAISGLDLSMVLSLKDHYESYTIEDMTKKISSIVAFKGIMSPMFKTNDGYQVDLQSRYFKEDFDYGLVILKSFADICNILTPYMDKVLKWYELIAHRKILDLNNKLIIKDFLLVPQNYGINTIEDIEHLYR